MDVKALTDNFAYRVSMGQVGKDVSLSNEHFAEFLNNIEIKNGFTFTILEYEIMNGQMKEMIVMSNNLIKLIDKEL